MKEEEKMWSTKLLPRGRMWVISLLLLASTVLFPSCSLYESKPHPPAVCPTGAALNADKPELPYSSINLDYPLSDISNPRLYVYKNNRRLFLVQDGVLIRDYLVGLGPSPCGDKKFAGDGRTPEGSFYVCVKNPQSQFYKSLGLSYPSPKHAEQALLQGTISPNDFRTIIHAFENKSLPPWSTPLGGAIFIHGGGGHKDWTKGCIAVGNSAMDELFRIVSVGTLVEVLP